MLEQILKLFFEPCCPCCQRINNTDSLLCLNCQPPIFDGITFKIHAAKELELRALSPWDYSGKAAELIKSMKAQTNTKLILLLADILVTYLQKIKLEMAGTLLIPAPLSKSSLHLRGYNQSLILAKQIGKKFRAPVLDGIFTGLNEDCFNQKALGREQRLVNRNYSCSKDIPDFYRSVTLVDDVITTGATISSMARAISAYFKGEIRAVSLARVN
jgi:ComF family protein